MTPEEWLEANLSRAEDLPTATLDRDGALVSRGKVHLNRERQRGIFRSTDGATPDLPISEAMLTVNGQRLAIKDVERCSAPMSDHWHFSLK